MKAGFYALTLGGGAAAGAVAGLMLPKQNAARKAMEKAAQKTENVVCDCIDKMNQSAQN